MVLIVNNLIVAIEANKVIFIIDSSLFVKHLSLDIILVALKRAGLCRDVEMQFKPSQSSWAEGQPGCWGGHHPGQW